MVDDEQNALEAIERELRHIPEVTDVQLFLDPMDALAGARLQQIDLAFLDIEMFGMTGLQLAKAIKDIQPAANIVFVTGHARYAVEAFRLTASDYLLKPVSEADIRRALEHLRHPVNVKSSAKLYVQCFGNFEVFTFGRPITFARAKTKELFAYLVSRRGAFCTNDEMTAVIWEEKESSYSLQVQFRKLVADLMNTFGKIGVSDAVAKRRGGLAVVPEQFQCDFYSFLRGDPAAVNQYAGEFMVQYSWAEISKGYLENLLRQDPV